MKFGKILTFFLIAIFLAGVILFFTKQIILDKFKSFLVEKIETSTGKGVKIGGIAYVPVKGVRLEGISVYKTPAREEEVLSAERAYVKFPLFALIKDKIFSPDIAVSKLKINGVSASGEISFSAKLGEPITGLGGLLDALGEINLYRAAVYYNDITLKNINGSFSLSSSSFGTKGLSFAINDSPYSLDCEVKDPLGNFSSSFKISSSQARLSGALDKKGALYKVPSLKGDFLNSSFSCMGEIKDVKTASLSLYGEAKIDLQDIAFFLPSGLKDKFETAAFEGIIDNSVYLNGSLKDITKLELGIKSSSPVLKIKGFSFADFSSEIRLKEGLLEAPIMKAYPYNGVLSAALSVDMAKNYRPYLVKCAVENLDISRLAQDTKLKGRNIKGLLFAEAAIKGDGDNLSTAEGSGAIHITQANLGPMPLLTPLLGNIFGYLQQNVFTGLKRIDITEATADFYIASRKIVTENLILWGDVVIIHASGYVGFDKTLNFEIENEFVEPEKPEEEDWQVSLQEAIAQVGKIMSTARLTGTIDNPEWKFEYFGGIKKMLKNKFGGVLKGIFE